jgi:putative hydrolase of the HAD superfamily
MIFHIFFDLDHTLWDFERNSNETLSELFDSYQLYNYTNISRHDFLAVFQQTNAQLWNDFNAGKITQAELRTRRFPMVFENCGILLDKVDDFGETYLKICPTKSHLIPGTMEVLGYLNSKNYPLSIITNGFPDTQYIKMKSGGISHFFEHVFTSENTGFKKPDKRMFEVALAKTKVLAQNSMMIGDTLEADIKGAQNAGMKTVFLNIHEELHTHSPDFEIKKLHELKAIL